ncbi:NADP-dependent oxidoreductase [Salinicoccus sp. YB14-2]|uniref:NADP-dependent oxidoreductase n=1 Tax=Salinicoccus sp. YB14-2 TaxID=1572701 RepID=UPI00068F5191|nr:NADP-dependent oxidoreductase [Salinicoccus sp. YB14-2]
MKNEQIVLAKRPEGVPEDDAFRFEEIDVKAPADDEVVVKSIYVSVDPYMRGRMSRAKSYTNPFEVDEPMAGHIIGKVEQSNAEKLKEGDYVKGIMSWQRYNTVSADGLTKIPDTDLPLHLYLSTLGMPGQTAYHGLLKIGKPEEGETVVVSAASGAVGSVVGQIAKIKGAHVVGIAGGKDKTSYLTETLGFDAGVDYKADDFNKNLEEAVAGGIDVYFENVGGPVSDEVFKHLNKFSRIVVCGAISAYNNPAEDIGPRIQPTLIKTQTLMQAFIVGNYADDFENADRQLSEWVDDGKIHTEVSIDDGFENIPAAFRKLFEGANFGKQIVKVAEE